MTGIGTVNEIGLMNVRISGPSYYGGAPAVPMLLVPENDYRTLLEQVATLQAKVANLERIVRVASRDYRDVSDKAAKAAIAKYFRDHDGKEIYPSDVAEALRLDYDQVARLIVTLERERKIAHV